MDELQKLAHLYALDESEKDEDHEIHPCVRAGGLDWTTVHSLWMRVDFNLLQPDQLLRSNSIDKDFVDEFVSLSLIPQNV